MALLTVAMSLFGWLPAFADISVTVDWNPSLDTNTVGYKVYYGGASGNYTNSILVGNVTNEIITGLTGGATYYFAATAVSSTGAQSPYSSEISTNVPIQPPTLDPISNITVNENSGVQMIPLTGISAGSGGNLTVNLYATSSITGIIPSPVIIYTNSGSVGTLVFGLATNASGVVAVTVTADNGAPSNNIVTQSFTVTVLPAPTLNGIANLTIYEDAGPQTIPLTGITSGTANQNLALTVWAYSLSPSITLTPTVDYTSPNSTGSIAFTPVPGAVGTANLSVKVNNTVANFSQNFTVTVLPIQPPILNAITNLTIYESSGLHTVSLTGITPGSGGLPIAVTSASSNPGIIPTPKINYTNGNSFDSLTFAPLTNVFGSSTITVSVTNSNPVNNVTTQSFTVNVVIPPGGNQPPTLNLISNLTLVQGTASATVNLTGITSGSPTQKQVLSLSATSSNPSLIPTPAIRYTSPATNGTLTLAPKSGLGTSVITVEVNNGGKSNNIVTQSFTVTMVTNHPPTLSSIGNVVVAENAGTQTIMLGGISSGSPTEIQTLTVSSTSSNIRLIPTPTIQYTNPADCAFLKFKPTASTTGTSTMTVTVNDGSKSNNVVHQTFIITVLASSGTNAMQSSVASMVAATLTAVGNANGQFGFQVTGEMGGQYVIQTSTDLIHWTCVQTNMAPYSFQEAQKPSGQKYYRAFYLQ
jgi:hypothetical protein